MTYMLEGEARVILILAGNFCGQNRLKAKKLLRVLCEYIVCFLSLQAKAGANVLMLFDSWAGAVLVRGGNRSL